jgi:hypothetical protein
VNVKKKRTGKSRDKNELCSSQQKRKPLFLFSVKGVFENNIIIILSSQALFTSADACVYVYMYIYIFIFLRRLLLVKV